MKKKVVSDRRHILARRLGFVEKGLENRTTGRAFPEGQWPILGFKPIGDFSFVRQIEYRAEQLGIEDICSFDFSVRRLYEIQHRVVAARGRGGLAGRGDNQGSKAGLAGRGIAQGPVEKEREPKAVFYDAETTGLSSGTGSLVFLLGLAWTDGEMVRLEQYFLKDFPGEVEYLLSVKKRLEDFGLFVSYNGKSFDSHILETRFLMNRMQYRMGSQLDMLHIVRRLWASVIGSCTLQDIEEKVLGERRHEDIPGYEIPDRYFLFQRSGDWKTVRDVILHNERDVLSLIKLVHLVWKIIDGKREEVKRIAFDKASFGHYMARAGEPVAHRYLLEAHEAGGMKAGKLLSLQYKRMGEWDKAVEIWKTMLERKSLFAAIELAKYYEHRARDYERAISYVREVSRWNMPADKRTRGELVKRLKRLERLKVKKERPG